jgi:polyphosphate kinase 2 (PPK2 family)
MVVSGIILLKYWLEVSPEEQARRLEARIDDRRKIGKLSKMDLLSFSRWDKYIRMRAIKFS